MPINYNQTSGRGARVPQITVDKSTAYNPTSGRAFRASEIGPAGTEAGTGADLNKNGYNLDFGGLTNPYSESGGSGGGETRNEIDPRLYDSLQATIDRLTGMIPAWEASQQRLAGLPGEIDAMTEDILRRYRLGSEDFIDNANMAANANAARGIQGGTTSDSLRVGLRDAMRKDLVGARQNVMNTAMQLKTAAIMGGPGAAGLPLQLLAGLYGQGQTGYGSSGSTNWSNQEDTMAVAQFIADINGL